MSNDRETHEDTKPQQARRLPIVVINGRRYFADVRLREYRAVDNPHDRIPMG
jgi:hypothetical protein